MKPQSRNLSGSQRDALCSPTEYLLMEITEELYPVYSIVGYRYRAFLKSGTERERADKFPGVKTER